uniref:Uncharacterized protein n=1 Tax=Anopheles melas TaxID=34690 RepID=A0A182TFM1_9DIPT
MPVPPLESSTRERRSLRRQRGRVCKHPAPAVKRSMPDDTVQRLALPEPAWLRLLQRRPLLVPLPRQPGVAPLLLVGLLLRSSAFLPGAFDSLLLLLLATARRFGEGLRRCVSLSLAGSLPGRSSCPPALDRPVADAFGEEAAVGGGLAAAAARGSVLIDRFNGNECSEQSSHCSGPGSSVISRGQAWQEVHSISRNSDTPAFAFCLIPNSSGDSSEWSCDAASTSCRHSFASVWWLGAVTIDGSFELLMCGPPLHRLWKWAVTSVAGCIVSGESDTIANDDRPAFDRCPLPSSLFFCPGGCIGWQLLAHHPTGKMSRESYRHQ